MFKSTLKVKNGDKLSNLNASGNYTECEYPTIKLRLRNNGISDCPVKKKMITSNERMFVLIADTGSISKQFRATAVAPPFRPCVESICQSR